MQIEDIQVIEKKINKQHSEKKLDHQINYFLNSNLGQSIWMVLIMTVFIIRLNKTLPFQIFLKKLPVDLLVVVDDDSIYCHHSFLFLVVL